MWSPGLQEKPRRKYLVFMYEMEGVTHESDTYCMYGDGGGRRCCGYTCVA